jgi:O-antigen ligase
MRWGKLFAGNAPLMLFYLYFALSLLWSGDPFGSLKRLSKDFGLLFVIGLIYTEKDPLQAMRAVFARTAFVLIPLSVLFVKYYPEYARAYAIAGDIMVTGVTTQKNSLGETVLLFTLFLLWDYLETLRNRATPQRKQIPWDRVILILMGAWLLHLSQSKTALLCTLMGVFLILRKGRLLSRTVSQAVLFGALSLPLFVFFSQKFSAEIAPLVQALGRTMTFTGRTDIWDHINLTTVNPLIGAGYWNFWGGPRGYAISVAMNTGIPNAHNGYVDLYLDGGLIVLALLLYLLVSYGRRIITSLSGNPDIDRFRRMKFAVLIAAIIYNLCESTFARMGPIWFTALLMMVDFPIAKMRRSAIKGKQSVEPTQSVPELLAR